MSHDHLQDGSIIIHRSRTYDVSMGWLIRRSDAAVLQRAGVGPGDRVLDVGTGPGYLALAASQLVVPGGAAVGIDASPEMVERARQRAAHAGAPAEYQVASAAALPFEDGSFDVVVTRLVVHHLSGDVRARALTEMHRVLRPGGRLVIADMASRAATTGHHLVAHLLGNHPEVDDELGRLAWDAGFRDVTTGPLFHGVLIGVAARRDGGLNRE
jgi:ubiquinone/menaquinone biosynthesis C-methylase UbiE